MTGFLFDPNATSEGALSALKLRVLSCTSCVLHEERTQAVFGVGKTNRPWVAFIGEGPGKNEDEQGVPFVGRAGDLLTGMINGMKLTREEVYIANAVACRPPDNRTPEPGEVEACRPHLLGQLRLVQPRYIVCLGGTAANSLLKNNKAIKNLRGAWYEWEGIKVRVTYHPAYLLRDPSKKAEAWQDLQSVMAWINRDRDLEANK